MSSKHPNEEIGDSEDDDQNITTFVENFDDKIVHKISNTQAIIKMTAGEFVRKTKNWTYNRDRDEEKVKELELCVPNTNNDNSILWLFSIVYDKYADACNHNLILIDGQHRKEAIKRMMKKDKIYENIHIYCVMYTVDNCETENQEAILDLFFKINNNRPLDKKDYPEIRILKLIEQIVKNIDLVPNKKAIRSGGKKEKANEPGMNKKELHHLLRENYDNLNHLSNENIISNLKIISRKISCIDYDNLYVCSKINKKRYDTATEYNFWLNLRSSINYNPEVWIKFIATPELFS
jgi:hypothetical protein